MKTENLIQTQSGKCYKLPLLTRRRRPSGILALFILITIVAFNSCGVYTFSGASINPNDSTFTVHFITNQSQIIVPSLSQTLTDALKNKLLSNTPLKLRQNGGDLEFSGVITNYQVAPLATQANETAALNRLTITVNIDFINHKDEKQVWTTSFSRYSDYNSSADLNSIQDQLIKDITDQLVEDIFNKAVVNW